ncbi:MAG: hypothetical protein ACPGUD_05015 [Parashewanella sp.]
MRYAVAGFILGIALPVFSLYIGLQFSSVLANILLFPTSAIGYLLGKPIGETTMVFRLGLLLFSGIFWSAIIVLVFRYKTREK